MIKLITIFFAALCTIQTNFLLQGSRKASTGGKNKV